MAKRVVLAVAGAGKTYYICREINPAKKNLILAYTHENVKNIIRELIDAHGNVPTLTSVMTFHSFVYRLLVCPYMPTIAKCFTRDSFEMRGITLNNPPKQSILMENGNYRQNPAYAKVSELEHYFNRMGQVYNEYTSKLVVRSKKGKERLIDKASEKLNSFFDQIMIDEFQDFREDDFELILSLSKSIDNILLVGDYYQHSVSALNNTGMPFEKGRGKSKASVTYSEFVTNVKAEGFDVDETTLLKTRRCPENVCDFTRTKLGIEIYADNTNNGTVIWVQDSDVELILENDYLVKLVYENSAKYSFRSQNWSYSKGNTFNDSCVILTKALDGFECPKFSSQSIAKTTFNKLYVALTRTKGSLYIITDKQFQAVKAKYLRFAASLSIRRSILSPAVSLLVLLKWTFTL